MHWLEREGATWRRSLWRGRKKIASALGGVDDRNTQKRLRRLEELGIVRIKRGGGRRRGCRKDSGLRGVANRYYPGPEIVDQLIVEKWIGEDDKREAEKWESHHAQRPAATSSSLPLADRFRQLAGQLETRAGP